MTKPSIVFAHGIWADGSCFQKLIPTLRAEGHEVMAAQYGLDTLKGDVDATIRTFGRVRGPIILVGHSYGGTVITHAGVDPRVAALVYIAALGPDETETSQGQQDKFPKTDVFKQIEVADGRVWMKPDGVSVLRGRFVSGRTGRRLCDPLRAGLRSFHPEATGWHRLAVEAELVHRGHRGSHRPSRPGTLRREAHGRHDRRGEEQPRSDALPTARCARRHPQAPPPQSPQSKEKRPEVNRRQFIEATEIH